MSIFKNIGDTISNTGRDVVSYSNRMTQISTLTDKMHQLEAQCNKLYTQIGEQFYKEHANLEPVEGEPFSKELTELRDLHKEIKQTEGYLRTLKGVMKCTNCGADTQHSRKQILYELRKENSRDICILSLLRDPVLGKC